MSDRTWKVSDLLLLVLAAGMAFGAFRYFWQPPPRWNMELFLSSFLAILAIATLGAFAGRPAIRRACQGYAAFCWLSLAFVLRGGFGVTTNFQAELFVEASKMGMAFGAICALVAALLLEPPQNPEMPDRDGSNKNVGYGWPCCCRGGRRNRMAGQALPYGNARIRGCTLFLPPDRGRPGEYLDRDRPGWYSSTYKEIADLSLGTERRSLPIQLRWSESPTEDRA